MKHWKGILSVSLLLLLLVSLIPAAVHGKTAGEEANLIISPKEALFSVENMKPGDYAIRILTLENTDSDKIIYDMKLINRGDLKLYNEMLFQLKAGNQVLFDGKLKDFSGFSDRSLAAGEEEHIEFYLKFPEELGNEFQGLRSGFILQFSSASESFPPAAGAISGENGRGVIIKEAALPGGKGTGTGTGASLPSTATSIFLFFVIGVFLLGAGMMTYTISQRKKYLLP